MKVIKFTLLVSLVVNFILIFTSIELFFEVNSLFRKKPELINPKNTNTISISEIEFNDLVKEKFPIGLSEKELIQELNKQGFRPGWTYENKHHAFFKTFNIPCRFYWRIIWEVDKDGKINKINGYHTDACL